MASVLSRTRSFPSRTDVGTIVILGAVFVVALAPKLDTDLWWHLWDGRYILDHHAVPTRDFLSFTSSGKPWTDHEWLSEILLYGLYRLAGLWGTIIGFAVIIAATWALVYVRMVRRGITPFLGLFVLLASFFISVPTWGARPQMLTLLFLAAFALILDSYRRRPARTTLILFPLLMLLWANLHGGWVLGIVLMVVTIIGEFLDERTSRPGALSQGVIRDLAAATVVTLVVTILTPNGISGLLYPLVWVTPGPFANVLTEWVSVDFHQLVYMVFEGLLLLFLVVLIVNRRLLSWTSILLLLAYTYLALSETRNVAVWAVVIAPILGSCLQGILEEYGPRRPDPGRSLQPGRERMINSVLLVLVLLILPTELLHFATPKALRSDQTSTFPDEAMTYMNRHHLPRNTLAAYAWGGYLIWRGYPSYLDFIDGRANTVFTPAVLQAYLSATSLQPHWNRVLSQDHVQNVLIQPNLPLAQGLAEDGGWRRVYKDSTAVLYTRNQTVSGAR